MKRSTIIKILLCVLVVVFALGCFFACGKKSTYNVVFMDGDQVISSTTVEPGKAVTLPTPSKEGATFVGWYSDAELTQAYVEDSEVNENLILYAKFSQRALSISVNSNGGSDVEKVSVTTGNAYTVPAPIKEGYDFVGYTYIDENNDEQPFSLTGTYTLRTNIRLTAQWRIKTFDVNFKNADESIIETQKVQYNQKASAITVKGYSIEGLYANKNFTGEKIALGSLLIKDNTDIYVNKVANSYRITVLGWNDLSCDVDYDSTYTLLNPADTTNAQIAAKVGTSATHEWSSFTGYTLDGQPFNFTGKYTWDKNISVVAVHEDNENYNMYTVTFFNTINNQTVTEIKVDKGETVAADFIPTTSATGYDFDGWYTSSSYGDDTVFTSETVINNNITIYSKFTPKNYIITCDGVEYSVTYGQSYQLPTEKFGYTFNGYSVVPGGNVFPASGTYDIAGNVTVVGDWAKDTTQKPYFKEDDLFIFLIGHTYEITPLPLSSDATNDNTISIFTAQNGKNGIVTNKLSDGFVFIVDGREYNAKIVDCVNTIGYGADFNNMIAVGGNSNVYQKTVAKNDYVMDVGVSDFIPDILISNLSKETIDLERANVTLIVTENSSPVALVADEDYTINGDTINFDDSYVGRTFTIEFAPKYALAEYNLTNPTLTVKLNDGVNVYKSIDLRNNYSDLSVRKINVLRNIKAELLEIDYASGYGQRGDITLDIETDMGTMHETMTDIDLGIPKNNFGKGVYARSAVSGTNDSIVVNGNFFTIDGSKLPYIVDATDRTEGMGYDLSNSQIGIFLYRSLKTDAGTSPETTYDDQTYRSNDGHAKINNLRISGNNIYRAQATQSGLFDLPFLKMSSAYIGMVVRGGTVDLDNIAIENVSMGVMLHGGISGYFEPGKGGVWGGEADKVQDDDALATIFTMADCSIKNAWCNDIYVFDLAEINLIGTQLNGCSGAAIHFDNRPYSGNMGGNSNGFTNCNNTLNMDFYSASHINNWVAGTEPWFVAYNRTGDAGLIKGGFETTIAAANPNLTVLQTKENVEMMNFAILVNPINAAVGSTEWTNDVGGPDYINCSLISEVKFKVVEMGGIKFPSVDEEGKLEFDEDDGEELIDTGGLKVFCNKDVDNAEMLAFLTGYVQAQEAYGAAGAEQWAMGQFIIKYGAFAFGGGEFGMGIYLPVYIKTAP